MTKPLNKYVLSLFSSAGVGELGLKANGLEVLLCNELLPDRCRLYQHNFPSTSVLQGDIWDKESDIIKTWNEFGVGSPFILYATPPCQGMSFNGVGKLQLEIREGRRLKEDPRNRLIIPTVDIIKALRPQWVILENVPDMQNTIIRLRDNSYCNIIDYIFSELKTLYCGFAQVINCLDYGMGQSRKRLITILSKTEAGRNHAKIHGTFFPEKSHDECGSNGLPKWLTLRDVIGNFPPLASKKGMNQDSSCFWHYVPVIPEEKYWWIENTPQNETAFNNQCVECGYNYNRRHGMCMLNGIHQSLKDTPLYCESCGALLPRPSMIDKTTGKRRLIKGFDSAYRRMPWDKPCPTLTQNFLYISSDKKLHPSQNRTLSIYEALVLQSIAEYDYDFSLLGKPITKNLICQIIGESVPPKIIDLIAHNILEIERRSLI